MRSTAKTFLMAVLLAWLGAGGLGCSILGTSKKPAEPATKAELDRRLAAIDKRNAELLAELQRIRDAQAALDQRQKGPEDNARANPGTAPVGPSIEDLEKENAMLDERIGFLTGEIRRLAEEKAMLIKLYEGKASP